MTERRCSNCGSEPEEKPVRKAGTRHQEIEKVKLNCKDCGHTEEV